MQKDTFPMWFKDPSSILVIKVDSSYNAVVVVNVFGYEVGEKFTLLNTKTFKEVFNVDTFNEICNCWIDVTEEYRELKKYLIFASIVVNENDEYSSSVDDIFCGVIESKTLEEAIKNSKKIFDYKFLLNNKCKIKTLDEVIKIAKKPFDYKYLKNKKCYLNKNYDISYKAKSIDELFKQLPPNF